MIHRLKAPGCVLVALLSMAALASTASAQFESEAETTGLAIASNTMQKIAPSEGSTNVECTTIKVTGTQTGKANTTVTVAPTYSNCETFLGAATSINTNGCKYVFHSAKGSTSGTSDVECEGSKTIEITVGSICKYTIGTQTGLSSIGLHNSGSGTTRDYILTLNLTLIHITRITNDFFCPAAGAGGTMTGSWTITGYNFFGGEHVGLWSD